MAVCSNNTLTEEMKNRRFIITPEKELGLAEFNISIVDKLYTHKTTLTEIPLRALDIPFDEFLKDYCEEVPLTDGFWLLDDKKIYYTLSEEQIKTDNRGNKKDYIYRIELTSRSSWARNGLYTKHASDRLDDLLTNKMDGRIPIVLKSATRLILRPGDEVGQIFIHKNIGDIQSTERYLGLGDVRFQKGGEPVQPLRDYYCFYLSLHPDILAYNGGIIDPSKPTNGSFVEMPKSDLIAFPSMHYFIASSAETIKLSDQAIAYLDIISAPFGPRAPFDVKMHFNAPYIKPGFDGTITLECMTTELLALDKNIIRPRLMVQNLTSPADIHTAGRYIGQEGPTTSKGYLGD